MRVTAGQSGHDGALLVAALSLVPAGCGGAITDNELQRGIETRGAHRGGRLVALDDPLLGESQTIRSRRWSNAIAPACGDDSEREPAERERAEHESEVPQGDVVILGRIVGQQVDDDPGEPAGGDFSVSPQPDSCTIDSQSVGPGLVGSDANLRVTYDCSISLDEIETRAQSLARKDTTEGGGDYSVTECAVVDHDHGECRVSYFANPNGIDCDGRITVERTSKENVQATQKVDCFGQGE